MKKLNVILLGVAVSLGGAAVADAQIRQGTQEVGFSGSYTHGTKDNDDSRFWNLSGVYGYFVSDQLEVLGIGQLQGQKGESTQGQIGAGADWHFFMQGNPNFIPFVGASYLFGISDTPDALDLHVGLKQFVTRNVAIKYQVGYGFDPSDTGDAAFGASVGLSFFF